MELGEGMYVDGSWELSILVDDLQVSRRIRVNGETHIGGLMLRLVEAIDVRMDWSDHGLWWPMRNRWLLKTRRTLDQCGVQSDAKLEFHRMHSHTQIQLPDLREVDIRVSYAQSVFSVVLGLCRELGIRHPEELSLQLVASSDGGDSGSSNNGSVSTLFRPRGKKAKNSPQCSPRQPAAATTATSQARSFASMGSLGDSLDNCLADSPRGQTPVSTLRRRSEQQQSPQSQQQPRTPVERAVASGIEDWLDSSRSLMEQGLRPGGGCVTAAAAAVASSGQQQQQKLRLRFKYHAHYDLNPQLDAVRINQLYEQVKDTVLIGRQQCTEEEALALAALQLQSELGCANEPQQQQAPLQHQLQASLSEDAQLDAEIDADLAELERSLSVSAPGGPGVSATSGQELIDHVPELCAWLKVSSQSSQLQQSILLSTLTLRSEAKRRYVILRDTQLLVCPDNSGLASPNAVLSLTGAEVLPEASSGGRLSIRVLPTTSEPGGSCWWHLRFPPEGRRQYAEWSAGLSLASRGRTLASRDLFAAEVRDNLARLELQRPATMQTQISSELDDPESLAGASIDPADYLPRSALKRAKPRVLVSRILERRAKVRDRTRVEAKLDYIRAWQRLPMSGVAYFAVGYSENQQQQIASFAEFRRDLRSGGHHSRVELFGVAFNRIMRLDPQSGEVVTTWRYNELDSWTVNWEVHNLSLSLRRPPHYICLTPCTSHPSLRPAMCKTLAEFIGGYVFLSLRKPEKSQELDEQLFQKLSCCRDVPAAS